MNAKPLDYIPGEIRDDIDQGVLTVGRPKKSEKKVGPLPTKTMGIRATGEWAAWADRLAKHCRTDFAKLVDMALVELAERRRFEEKPPERVP